MQRPSVVKIFEHGDWNDMVLNAPGSSFFHTSNWAKVLQNAYGYTPLYLTNYDRNHLAALLPVMEVNSCLTGKRGVSLPFTDYCKPIMPAGMPYQSMIETVMDLAKDHSWKYVEFRGGENIFHNQRTSESYYGHTLDLTPGFESLFANLHDSTRRNINKAKKLGLNVIISTSLEAVREFYRLNKSTRRVHGLPPQPYHFFQCLHDHVLSHKMGFMALAFNLDRVIACNIYLCFGDEVIYKYGASDRRYQHLKANNLVMWEAIKWSCLHGYHSLNFGRTELDNEGLRRFKSGWGGREHYINYYRYDLQRDMFIGKPRSIDRACRKLFSKLPTSALVMAGKFFYHHMG